MTLVCLCGNAGDNPKCPFHDDINEDRDLLQDFVEAAERREREDA